MKVGARDGVPCVQLPAINYNTVGSRQSVLGLWLSRVGDKISTPSTR